MYKLILLSASLLVSGMIHLPTAYATSCKLNVNNPDIDFGQFNRSTLNNNQYDVQHGQRTLHINIQCDEPSDMTLFYRAAMFSDKEGFVFGNTGRYTLRLRDVTLDGERVEVGEVSGNNLPTGDSGRAVKWRPERGITPVAGGQVLLGRSLSAQVDIIASLPQNGMNVRDRTVWEESALIDMATGLASQSISVKASIMPLTCTPTLSNGGVVDFGKTSAKELHATQPTTLPAREIQLNVHCDSPVRVALNVIDNQHGTTLGNIPQDFGLGLDNSGNPIGHYRIALDTDKIQTESAVAAYLTELPNEFGNWSAAVAGEMDIAKNTPIGISNTASVTSGPTALETLNARLSIKPVIAPIGGLRVTDEISLKGSATIEIIYL